MCSTRSVVACWWFSFATLLGPGCDVLAAPAILGPLVTSTGTAQPEFFLPNAPPLVGVTFYHQMVPIEVGAGGAWTAITATNALQLVAGRF